MASQAEREQVGRRGAILERALAEARAELRRQARRNSPGEPEAEEALQEASIDFLCSYDGPAGIDAVRWLQIAVKHRAWNLSRAHRRHAARVGCEGAGRELVAVGVDPGERAERAEAVELFFAAFMALKPDERTALLLLGLGCSYLEIGARQGWTHTKVNRCLVEGRAALRALIDRSDP